ncbi:MAG: DNA replication and repair protein RecF [Bacilli bacterium]
MSIKRLELINFRNHESLVFTPRDDLNIIVGENGSGKTNIIEALYVLMFGRSWRTSDITNLIENDKNQFVITAQILNSNISHKVTLYCDHAKKRLFLNDKPIKSPSELMEILNGVLFNPSMVNAFIESQDMRRNLLDSSLGRTVAKYRTAYIEYKKLLKERNEALKEQVINDKYIYTLTTELVARSHSIAVLRDIYVKRINEEMPLIAKAISNKSQNISLVYEPLVLLDENYESNLLAIYKANYALDKLYKVTQIGVHKENYYLYIDGVDMATHASQGENRLAILCFILASAKIIKRYDMIILLDDVLSELDETNIARLIEYLKDCGQVFISATKTDYKEYEYNAYRKGE